MAALRARLGPDAGHVEPSFRDHAEIARLVAAGEDDRALLIGRIGRKDGSCGSLRGGIDPG